ncbi:site-specific integrase [Actinotalea sp.]|uniref:tyrosine-type recombinase/integrase n=1 Tax=Actinotalea sp. TaxID=1872145 RepID=UPI002C9B7A7E|nr:site-specific integrase [Actinotalea sp.]HRA50206.1 site-specific integrase [Actinotalea sp.]
MGTRAANNRSSVFQSTDGRWYGFVTMGTKPDGSSDRRKRSGRTQAEVTHKVRALERVRDEAAKIPAGRSPRLSDWLEDWLTASALRVRPNSLYGYTTDVRAHIIPTIGKHRLADLEPEHVEYLYTVLLAKGLNVGTVHHVRRTLNKALNDAVRRRRIPRNPVTLAHTPRYDAPEFDPLTVSEARTLMAAADNEPNGVAFMLAISLGLRRGEVLGLSWADVDLELGRVRVRQQLERRRYRHGCDDPTRCDDRPSKCPQRRDGGLVLAELKTRQSKRTLPMPQPMIEALRRQRQSQRKARIYAGSEWQESGLVFTTVTGRPIDPSDHSVHWVRFLERAGVRPARLHDARHTAATLLLVQGVDQRVVMDMLGWTSPTMTARYQHVVPGLVEEANRRMGELLWGAVEGSR